MVASSVASFFLFLVPCISVHQLIYPHLDLFVDQGRAWKWGNLGVCLGRHLLGEHSPSSVSNLEKTKTIKINAGTILFNV